jgi:DNA repair exonuclease SbcCD ATPase subunit
MFGSVRLVALGDQSMPAEMLTYAALGARLKISAEAARSLAKRLRLPRTLSHDGKALMSVDLAGIRHTPRPQGTHLAGTTLLRAKIETLRAEIARLEARAANHRADFERERERADRLMTELLQATAETMAAKEATARLEGELTTLRIGGRAIGGQEQAARRPGHLAATIVAADRKARG